MQLLFDFFPLLAFFIAYKFADIFVATGVIIAAVIIQTALQWMLHRKVSQMALISGGLVLVFGGLTLWIHDEAFIKWKVTAVYWLFAAGFLITQFIGERPMVQRMLGTGFTLERSTWMRLNLIWSLFFLALGALNIYVIRTFSTDFWVKFKVFGVLGLVIVFFAIQFLWLSSKMSGDDNSTENSP
jgi:intracellular septation protein